MHQNEILITLYKLCQGIRNESRINFRRQLRERMLQLRQQRRQAAELRNNPAAAAEGSAPLLSDEAPAGSSASPGNSVGNPGNFYAEGEEGGANRQRLNIVGPPERSPTLEGGPAYEEPRPLSRSVATSTAELPADSGGLYHVSEPLRTVWFRPGGPGHQEGSSNSSTSNLQLRRISRLNSAPGGGVTLATNNGGSRVPRIESGGAVASGIFEESVQRVTLAVGEGEAAPPPPPPPLPHQQEEEEEQEMVEEERIVEDIVREMMRNEGSVRQRWVH
jgi:hypothetical protein